MLLTVALKRAGCHRSESLVFKKSTVFKKSSSHVFAPWTFRRLKSGRPIKVRWYYNTDEPLSKPEWFDYTPNEEPTKFTAFSEQDNARLEEAYARGDATLEVREDHLFEVNLKDMVLSTVYWKGPVYEVRRGTWFTWDGTPLSARLATKVEDEYNKLEVFDLTQEAQESKESVSTKDLALKFNEDLKDMAESEAFDIEQEDDIVDLGNGQAIIFFDQTHGAIFPKSLSTLEVNIIRSLQPAYGFLKSVIPVQRGFTKNLESSVIDSVTPANVSSLTGRFQSEVASIFSKSSSPSESKKKEEADKKEKFESSLENDYNDDKNLSDSKRHVEHLVLCVHGIGQLLGYKYASVHFTHSVNVMRKTMKNVFSNEERYQKLAYGSEFDPKNEQHRLNNKIQVLPVSWRDQVSFHPRKGFNFDDKAEHERLPTLSQINVDGVRPLRNIVGDVVLDLLLFYEPLYFKEIMSAVAAELNRVYRLFRERNPDFNGKIHLFGHSLGSAICFDTLSNQKSDATECKLDFDVENLFCVGSPVGMFQLLKQKNIKPRSKCDESEINPDAKFSSPKCKNLYNVFHPCDPVSYRMEPLVHPKFANLRAEEVPFALKGFNTQVQSLTSFSDDIQERLLQATKWFKRDKEHGSGRKQTKKEENALGDIISTLTSPVPQRNQSKDVESETFTQKNLGQLLELNRTGRVDYSLPMGVFSVALVSAISAHISYFEDEETAGFVMKEILSCNEPPVKSRDVSIVK